LLLAYSIFSSMGIPVLEQLCHFATGWHASESRALQLNIPSETPMSGRSQPTKCKTGLHHLLVTGKIG